VRHRRSLNSAPKLGALWLGLSTGTGKPTGHWFLAVAGSALKGSTWFYAGPANPIPGVDSRRIRLLHSGQEIYLAKLVGDMFEALYHLERDISDGRLRLVGTAVDQQLYSGEVVLSTVIQVLLGAADQNCGEKNKT